MHRFDVHRIFFGQKCDLTNYQIRVYGSPRVKAIATRDPDVEKVQAAITIALSQAFDPLSRDFHKVYFFVPDDRKPWVIEQIRSMATALTKRIRAEQAEGPEVKERGQKVLRVLKEWIGQLNITSGTTSWPTLPPDHWAAFGYTSKDKIPSWVNVALG